ncbi:MAG: exodeoxyribonuclease VII small subunit [Bacillota bacterium]
MSQNDNFNIEKKKDNDLNFEEAINQLEKIVQKLESGGLNLNDSLEKFNEGVKLIKFCNKELDQAEKKVEKVIKEDEEYGDIVPFQFEEE